MDMGGGTWDKETVTRALQAAYNNPERAVDYLYSVCITSKNLLLFPFVVLGIIIVLTSRFRRYNVLTFREFQKQLKLLSQWLIFLQVRQLKLVQQELHQSLEYPIHLP